MASKKPSLRAVKPGEKAPAEPKRKKTVAEAADSGTHRDLLVAMRERIAQTVTGDCPPRDLAALTRRLQDIAKEIEAIDLRAKEEGTADAPSEDESWDGTAL